MRVLCLHGAGTSSSIFALQLAALRHQLREDEIIFDFIDGEWDAPPAHGISKVYPGPYRAFYPWDPKDPTLPCEAMAEAYDYLTEVLEENKYDGIIGFSQGASLAASYILHQHNRVRAEPVVRFAVFMCGMLPWDSTGTRRLRPEDARTGGSLKMIDIPTLHIHGALDDWVVESRELKTMCRASEAVVFEHPLGHTIPVDRKSTALLADLVRDVIRRAVFKH